MDVNGITWEQVKSAPSLKTVLKRFNSTFGADVTPTTYGGNLDIIFFPASYRKAGMQYPFDYHTFNIWVLCYTFMARHSKLTNKKRFHGFTLEEVAGRLNVKIPNGRHDALIDCEFEAAVFRKIIKAL